MLTETKSLLEKLSWARPSDLLWWFFLLIRMLCLCFLHLNLIITVLFLQTVTCLKIIRFHLVRDNALQTLLSRTSSSIEAGTGFISSDLRRWYCALLTAFLSNWTILSFSKGLKFFWPLALKKVFHIVSGNHRNNISLIYLQH